MADLLHIPFEPGLSDSTDPTHIGGRLYQATNVRYRKLGRASKKYGQVAETFVGATGTANAVGEWQGVPFVAADAQLIVLPNTGLSAKLLPGRMSRVLPKRADTIVSWNVGTTDAIVRSDVCYSGSLIVYTWDTNTGNFGYSVRAGDNTPLYQSAQVAGHDTRAIYSEAIYLISVNSTTLRYFTVSSSTYELAGPTTLGTLSAATSVYDAAITGAGGSTWYVVYQSSATVLTVKRVVNGTVTATATPTVNTVCKAISMCVGTFGVFIAYIDASDAMSYIAYDGALTTLVGPNALFSATLDICPAVFPYSATQVLVLAGGSDTTAGTNSRYTKSKVVIVSSGASSSSGQFWHMVPASRPFFVNNVRIGCWFCTDNDLTGTTGWTNQRTYWMLDVLSEAKAATDTPSVLMTASPIVGFVATAAQACRTAQPSVVILANEYLVPLLDVLHQRQTLTSAGINGDLTAVKAVSWYDAALNGIGGTSNLLYSRRDFVEANGAVHFGGGFISEYMGELTESGFVHYPVITEAKRMTGAGGFGATGSTYNYSATFEWFDPQGRRHRSQPSDPASLALGSSDNAQVKVTTLAAGKGTQPTTLDAGGVQVVLYRTAAGGTTYYRASKNISGANAAPNSSAAVVTLTDVLADTTLTSQEILYTLGGVLGNLIPPAARYLATGGNRVWLAGLLEPRRVALSKLIVRGEPVQFPDDATFRIDLPEDITGIKWGDGALIVFSERSIYIVNGDGPNDQGFGSFSAPQRLPTDVGCVEHHSILETQDGWMFQAARGIYLLPRGFGPPVFVGRDVQTYMAANVLSAALVNDPGTLVGDGETTARFSVGAEGTPAGRSLVWDTALKKWISIDSDSLALIGQHDGRAVTVAANLASSVPVRQESHTAFGPPAGTFTETHQRTGQIRPFGLLGYGRVDRIQVIGELRGADPPALLNVRFITDGLNTETPTAVGKTGAAGQRFVHQYTLEKQQCNSIDVEVWDSSPTGASEGLVLHGITLETTPLDGLPRLGEGDRS
ncbi:MAG: hypothetical protein EPO32_14910 [Anaerolineae bacterium]|nr:MAG: hypothetical protein EPO32_14910 [Anaerolineae bacterium]